MFDPAGEVTRCCAMPSSLCRIPAGSPTWGGELEIDSVSLRLRRSSDSRCLSPPQISRRQGSSLRRPSRSGLRCEPALGPRSRAGSGTRLIAPSCSESHACRVRVPICDCLPEIPRGPLRDTVTIGVTGSGITLWRGSRHELDGVRQGRARLRCGSRGRRSVIYNA